jgi:phage portal protein BeeE
MKIIDRVASIAGFTRTVEAHRQIEEVKAQTSTIVSSYVTSRGSMGVVPEKTYNQLVDAYKSWVYTCIDKIAKAVAMIPLKLYVYRRQGAKVIDLSWRPNYKALTSNEDRKYFLKEMNLKREEIYDHPFLTLINHPNSFMTRFMLWYETMIRLELGGMCGWYKINNGLGIPGQIWPLPLTKWARLTPQVSSILVLEHWNYQDGNINQQFKPEEILLMKYPNPVSPFLPMSPLMAQTYPYDIDLFLMQQQKALFEHGAMPGLHLTTDQRLNKELVRELKEQIDEQYAGAIRSGETLITHSGLKADKLGQTGREAMIGVVANYARDKLITSFDLSPGKVGLVEDVNRANAEALNATFVNECLRPKCLLVEEVIETFLLPTYDQGLTCDFDLPDLRDKEYELKAMETRLNNYVTNINEERNKIGMDPKPWGDKPWISFTMTQIGTPTPTSPVKEIKILNQEFWTEERKEIHWKVFVKRSEVLEWILIEPLRHYFKAQQEEVIARLNESGKSILGQYSGWGRQKVQAHFKENKAVSDININKKIEQERIRELVAPRIKEIMKEVGDARVHDLLESLKVTIEFNVNDPAVLKWMGKRMRNFSKEVTGTSFDEIEAILRSGFTEGQPVATIAQTLADKFESWDQYRAPLIARTETIAAMNQADLESVSQLQLEDQLDKHWLTAGDEKVRDTHQKAGKEYGEDGIAIDEDFKVGQDLMQAPGDGRLAEENINCRCTLYYTEKTEG